MNRHTATWPFVIACFILLTGCSSGVNPLNPANEQDLTSGLDIRSGQHQTHLWGYFEVVIDVENETVSSVQNRSAMFIANVVNFMNMNPMSMSFDIIEIITEPDYIDVDINVVLTHPFPGMPDYHGYDIRGIFMGDGSAELTTGGGVYPVPGTDQSMLPDADDGYGGPDGYTRWYNISEFSEGTMPLLSYTQGNLATPGFSGTATLNPYSYFADGLGEYDNLWTWLNNNPDSNGQFSSGATNARNYYLRFPTPSPNVVYGYAVIADWIDNDTHPANTQEAIACDVTDTSDVWYVDSIDNGGNLIFDISVFDWGSEISAGVMEDYGIIIESSVLSAPYSFDTPGMTPVDGNENYSTYSVEIPADNVSYLEGNEYWIVVEYPDHTYANDFGVPNLVEDETLRAYFRYNLDVSNLQPSSNPVCDVIVDTGSSPPMPYNGPAANFTFDASASYDPDGGALAFEWDFDNDSVFGDSYDSGTDDHPTKFFDFTNTDQVCVRITDDNSGESSCCVDVDITIAAGNLKNIPLRAGIQALDLGIRHSNDDVFILYGDDQVWKYVAGDNFQTGTYVYTVDCNNPSHTFRPEMLDVNYLGDMILADDHASPEAMWTWRYSATGTKLAEFGLAGACTTKRIADVATFGNNGTNTNYMVCLVGGLWSGYSQRLWWYNYSPPNYSGYVDWASNYAGSGISSLHYDYITAYDTDYNGVNLWVLEGASENHVTMWEHESPGGWPHLKYAGSYFSSSTSSANWHSPIDLTRDSDNRLLLLDEDSGQGIVTFWTGSVSGGSFIGEIGNSSTISETPRRIDGSDLDGKVFVLHGDSFSGSDSYKLSVFLSSELP